MAMQETTINSVEGAAKHAAAEAISAAESKLEAEKVRGLAAAAEAAAGQREAMDELDSFYTGELTTMKRQLEAAEAAMGAHQAAEAAAAAAAAEANAAAAAAAVEAESQRAAAEVAEAGRLREGWETELSAARAATETERAGGEARLVAARQAVPFAPFHCLSTAFP